LTGGTTGLFKKAGRLPQAARHGPWWPVMALPGNGIDIFANQEQQPANALGFSEHSSAAAAAFHYQPASSRR